MKNSKAISGTELVEGILGGPDVDRLLKAFKNKEHAVLEFKASWKPCEGDDASEDDCRWNVIKAIIAMANASGGCVILGIAENKSAVAGKGQVTLLPGAFDPDGILEDPKREDKDLIAHTLSELFKGDGFFSLKTKSGRSERLKVEHIDELRVLVEPVEVCDCKAISGKVLVLIVHPCEKGNFFFVEKLPESRIGNQNPKKVLYYRDAYWPEIHRIDDIEKMAKYCDKRKIGQPKYTRMLNDAEGKKPDSWKKLAWLAIFALLATISLVEVQKHFQHKHKAEEAQRKAEEEQRAKEEAQRKAEEEQQAKEEAQRKAEEAQRKAEEANAQYDELQKRMEQLLASQESSQKDLEEIRAKLEEATQKKSMAERAMESAKQFAQEIKDKADNAMDLYQRHSAEQKLWKSYCGHVKEKQADYSKDVKNLRDVFTAGLKTKSKSVSSAFDDARHQSSAIALSRETVLNLVHEAAEDRRNQKTNDSQLLYFIESAIVYQFQKACVNACKKFVDDGREYEGDLSKRFNRFKDSDLQKYPENLPEEWKNGIARQIASVVAPPSYFPQKVFEKDNERIIKTSEAIARIVLKEGRKEIDFMVKHPDKWRKTDVSKLQKKLTIAVEKELNSIVDALQRDAVKHVSDAAEAACDAYLKAGKDLAKAVTRKDD